MSGKQNKEICCGCSACSNVCPKDAITMTEDEEGFLYPSVEQKKCIQCGCCEQVCPVGNTTAPGHPYAAYLIQEMSDQVRLKSTSGAAVNAIAVNVLRNGGCVIGAELSEQVVCQHIVIENEEELRRIQGSKYVQSDLGDCFSVIRRELKKERLVLFVGMGCQVAGLKAYLNKEYDNLITIDLACHGVPSPGIFREYIEYLTKKHHKQVTNVVFRDKSYGYSASNVKVYFSDGTSTDCRNDIKTFTRLMFNGLSLRPSCYECAFKTEGRVSDLTLFDCAMVGTYAPEFDDDKGTTSVLVHSEKAIALIKAEVLNGNMRAKRVNAEELIKSEGTMLTASAKRNPKREDFFEDRTTLSYEELTKKYAPATSIMFVGNLVKRTLRFTGPLGKSLLKMNKRNSIREYQKKYKSTF